MLIYLCFNIVSNSVSERTKKLGTQLLLRPRVAVSIFVAKYRGSIDRLVFFGLLSKLGLVCLIGI